MKHFIFLLSVVVSALTLVADDIPVDPELRYGKLANGLTYYVRHAEQPRERADFYLVCNAGSINEHNDERGLAHLLEHLAYSGTVNFPGSTINDYLQTNGVSGGNHVNASTSYDNIQFQITSVPTARTSMLDSILLIMRDMACNFNFDTTEIAKQKLIVEQERINTNDLNNRLIDQITERLLAGTRYAVRAPLGLTEVVANATPEQLAAFYHRWFQPRNLALVVVGDFDPKLMEQKVTRIMDLLENDPAVAETLPAEATRVPQSAEPQFLFITDPEINSVGISFYDKLPDPFPYDRRNTTEFVRYTMINSIVQQVMQSRMTDIISAPQTPLLSIDCTIERFLANRIVDAISITADVHPFALQDAINTVATELLRFRQHGITATELEHARNTLNVNYDHYAAEVDKHATEDYADEYIRHFLDGGYIPGVVPEVELSKRLIADISLDEINRYLASRIRPSDFACVITALPDLQIFDSAQAVADLDSISNLTLDPYVDIIAPDYLMAKKPTAGKIKQTALDPVRGITTMTLGNGIKVQLKPTTIQDNEILIDITAKGGLCSLDTAEAQTIRMLDEVVESSRFGGHSIFQVNKYLASHPAQTQFHIDEGYRSISGGAPRTELETLFQLCHLYFTDITPDEDAYAKLQLNLVNNAFAAQVRPELTLNDSIVKNIYHNDPWLRTIQPEEISAVDFNRTLEVFHTLTARPQDYVVSIVGNFDIDSIRPLIATYFASLPAGKGGKPVDMAFTHSAFSDDTLKVSVDNLPAKKARVTGIAVGNMEYNITNDVLMEFYANFLSAMLNQMLREEFNYTYGVDVEAFVRPSNQWFSSFSFDTDDDINRIDLTHMIATEMRDVELPAMDLETMQNTIDEIRNFIKNKLHEKEQSNGYWLSALQGYAVDLDVITGRLDVINSISAEQLCDFFSKMKPAGSYTLVQLNPEFRYTPENDDVPAAEQ